MTAHPNVIEDHPLTRREVVEHIRSIRRTIKRARDFVAAGSIDEEGNPVVQQLNAAMRRCDDAKLSLVKARPSRRKVRREGPSR